jgi:hypothetical protein
MSTVAARFFGDSQVPTTSALDIARADLATVETELASLIATKGVAIRNSSEFNKWRIDHDARTAERERLLALIEVLEVEAATAEAENADAALRKRYADRKTANVKLAARIKADLAKANSILLALFRDVASAQIEDSAINDRLPEGLGPLIPANELARGRAALPSTEIGRERVWLWADVRNNLLIGDQSTVIDDGGGFGHFGEGPYYRACRAVLVEKIERHPATRAERADPVWQVRLPQADGASTAFDGTRCYSPEAVIARLDDVADGAPAERPVEIELRPLQTTTEAA